MNSRKLLLAAIVPALLLAATTQAQIFTASLSGPNENPSNASPGTGFTTVTLDLQLHTFRVQVDFTGLQGTVTAAHIHGPITEPNGNAGVMTQTPSFSGFPSGVTFGTYDMTFDMTLDATWNGSFITSSGGSAATAEAAFVDSVTNGTAYLNIHSSAFGGGEIRGFLVPEPSTTVLLGLGIAGAAVAAWRRARNLKA